MAYFNERPIKQRLVDRIHLLTFQLDVTVFFDDFDSMSYNDLHNLCSDLENRVMERSFPNTIKVQGNEEQEKIT